jgi:hypothetical protein
MMNKVFILLTLLIFIPRHGLPQEWTVSDEDNVKTAPFKFTDEIRKTGEKVFLQNCTSCHGIPGKSNFVQLVPPPGDPATDKFQKQTDGALFHKMTTGKGAMPSFRDILTEEERWSVISYFRSFNKRYVQPEPVSRPTGKYEGTEIAISTVYDSVKSLLSTKVVGISQKDTVPISGLELSLYAKRYFGKLLIDEPKITNSSGIASFAYNKILPGDTAGNITVLAQINAEGLSEFKKEEIIHAGTVLNAPSLIETRAMWTISSQAPIWLLLSYSLVVIGVWSFLIYIIFQIVKIRRLGKQP